MPTPALRPETPTFEPHFVESITNYIVLTCRGYRVRGPDVSDVVQEALITIFRSVDTFQPEKGDFEAWARGVSRNVIRRHRRCAKRYDARFSEYHSNVDEYPTHAPSPERCAQQKQARNSILNALEALTTQQACIVVSFDVDDMSHAEIGNDLGISEAASHVCHKRAHKCLAKCLDRELLSVMPPSLTSCDEPFSSKESRFQWSERSHYASQILAAVIALLFVVSSGFETQMRAPMTEETRVLGLVHNASMYRFDELRVHRDAPSGKPEPAQMTSVRDVPAPSKRADKLPPRSEYVPRLSHKHEPNDPDRRPNGR
jgi:RNA polymerase sigma factor (sigma-70 family)